MNNFSALGALKRRWWVIVLLMLIGGALGALPKPAKVTKQSQFTTFTATETLLANDTEIAQSGTTAISPNQVPLFATVGEVPKRVKAKLNYAGTEAELAGQVTVTFDVVTGALRVTTTQPSAGDAELIANTFGDELNGYLAERQDEIYQQRLAASLERLGALETQVKDLTNKLAISPDDPILAAQRDAISRQYSVAFEQNQSLAEAPPVLAFTTLQKAQAIEDSTSGGGLSAPTSRLTRGALGGVAGLALGFGVVMLLGVLDRRIRSREQAEEIMNLRARVMIPKVKSTRRGLVVSRDRHDPLSDSYRTLRNVIGFVQSTLPPVERPRITLVVSPGPGEGKTSLAANLGAAFVETGQRTVVVNTDFRRPRLADVVSDSPPQDLPFDFDDLATIDPQWLLRDTHEPNMSLLDLSTLEGSAGDLARATAHLLPHLGSAQDTVVVDTSPVGATAEVLELVPLADVIVIVVKVGQTSIETAERTIAILRDISTAPIVLVLTGLKPDRSPYYEYTEREPVARVRAAKGEQTGQGSGQASDKRRDKSRKAAKNTARATIAATVPKPVIVATEMETSDPSPKPIVTTRPADADDDTSPTRRTDDFDVDVDDGTDDEETHGEKVT
jgi:Mrp family chromosome partitioning ATPase